MKNSIFLLILLINIFCSASCNRCAYCLEKKDYFDDQNRLIATRWYVNDTSRFGYEIYYDTLGHILYQTPYEFDNRKGVSQSYYLSGRTKSLSTWDDLTKQGPVVLLNDNGSPNTIFTYKNDKPIGPGYGYDGSGDLSRYLYFNNEGFAVFSVDYKTIPYSFEGNPIIDATLSTKKIKQYDSIEIRIKIANPPRVKSSILVGEVDLRNEVINEQEVALSDTSTLAIFKKQLSATGTFNLCVISKLSTDSAFANSYTYTTKYYLEEITVSE